MDYKTNWQTYTLEDDWFACCFPWQIWTDSDRYYSYNPLKEVTRAMALAYPLNAKLAHSLPLSTNIILCIVFSPIKYIT